MKKLLISMISLLLIILIVVTVAKGIKIGKLEILGVNQLKNADEELDDKVAEATKLASTDFKNKKSEVDSAVKELESEKNKYSEMTEVSTENQIAAANQIRIYDIGKLWTKYGNYAKREGITIKIETKNLQEININGIDNSGLSADKKNYLGNLSFTASGSYVGIEEFITDIEDDTELGFRIQNFKMNSNSGDNNTLNATFDSTGIIITGIMASGSTTTDNNSSNSVDENIPTTNNSNTNSTSSNNTNSQDASLASNNTTNSISNDTSNSTANNISK